MPEAETKISIELFCNKLFALFAATGCELTAEARKKEMRNTKADRFIIVLYVEIAATLNRLI